MTITVGELTASVFDRATLGFAETLDDDCERYEHLARISRDPIQAAEHEAVVAYIRQLRASIMSTVGRKDA